MRSLKILLSLLILKMVCNSFDKYFVNAKECEGVAELKRIGESKRMENDCEERQSLSSFNLKLYLSKLPEKTKEQRDGTFSQVTVSGKQTLGKSMSNFGKKVNLSKEFKNSCVRVTGINLRYESGMWETDNSAVTGYKDTRSIQRYFRKNEKNAIRASVLAG